MKNAKITALILSVLLIISLVACSADTQNNAAYHVGICQLVQHDAHDAATEGFIDTLNELLPGEVSFDIQNASNEIPLCTSIVNKFITDEADLILANATPALQAAAAATDEIPILGTSVTDYAVVMGLEDFDGIVGSNVSGTSDLAPLDVQANMVSQWFPDAKTIGLLYCTAESNSRYQANGIEIELTALGYECIDVSFTDANDLPLVLENAINTCDVLYVPTDNTVAACSAIIDNYCRPAGLPIIGGDKGICSACTVATIGVDYYDLGCKTAQMAAKILTGEADVAQMPIEYADYTSYYNAALCAELNISVPDGYTAITD